jgi:hypothetical protein
VVRKMIRLVFEVTTWNTKTQTVDILTACSWHFFPICNQCSGNKNYLARMCLAQAGLVRFGKGDLEQGSRRRDCVK